MNRIARIILTGASILIMALAGCSFRTEIDYSKQVKSPTRTPSGHLTGDYEKYKSSFHVEAESRMNDAQPHDSKEGDTNTGNEVKPTSTRWDQPPTPSPQIIVIQSEPPVNITNHVQFGDINNHTHVYLTRPPSEIPEHQTATRPAPVSPLRIDERCEQLRRHHETTVRKWQRFFE